MGTERVFLNFACSERLECAPEVGRERVARHLKTAATDAFYRGECRHFAFVARCHRCRGEMPQALVSGAAGPTHRTVTRWRGEDGSGSIFLRSRAI